MEGLQDYVIAMVIFFICFLIGIIGIILAKDFENYIIDNCSDNTNTSSATNTTSTTNATNSCLTEFKSSIDTTMDISFINLSIGFIAVIVGLIVQYSYRAGQKDAKG